MCKKDMKIELLSPAGTVQIGRAAIAAGADAIYIGGANFGARKTAGNDMAEIVSLVEYAHSYDARVYLTMNTILYNDELKEASKQAWQAWEAGVDALIVQDMAFLEMDMPPIALHSSTQMFNYSVERVKFLQEIGFERVVLERALTLEHIRAIREQTTVELEAFIHGSICVGYSGQCYLSQALCGRGGNRGECAQSCRSRYNLINDKGEVLQKGKELLSVGDMNLSDRLVELIDAGVCSLKIEGRLKDESYVVNNTAYYNQKLKEQNVSRTSSGISKVDFEPDPLRSFAREAGHYYFDGVGSRKVGAPTKSLGEKIGVVKVVNNDNFIVQTSLKLSNGDGICWQLPSGELRGSNVNKVVGNQIFPNKIDDLNVGCTVFRNFSATFHPTFEHANRKISASIQVCCDTSNLHFIATDETLNSCSIEVCNNFEVANNAQRIVEIVKNAMSKSGDTIFDVQSVEVDFNNFAPLIKNSELNDIRRSLLSKLRHTRIEHYQRSERKTVVVSDLKVPQDIDYKANVSNSLAENFYKKLGAENIEKALELQENITGKEVMRTKYCIRREQGTCLLKGAKNEPLFLENRGRILELKFDCGVCEMALIYRGSSPSMPAQNRAKS